MRGRAGLQEIIICMNTNFNIIDYLKKAAEEYPDRPALFMSRESKETGITFKGLWGMVDSFSVGLKTKGLRPGDRCVIMIPMSIDLYVALLGIIKMGGVAVFVDPWITYQQIAAFCVFAKPKGFIGIPKSHYLRFLDKRLLFIPLTFSTEPVFLSCPAKYNLRRFISQYRGDHDIYSVSENDPALITFTSGSSGTPKGANRTHGFLSAQYKALSSEFQYDSNNIDMPMFPVFALSNLAAKIPSIIPDMDFRNVNEVNAEGIIRQMNAHKVTNCTASPPFVDRLAEYVQSAYDRPHFLRKILTGGGPVTTSQLKQWQKAFPGIKIDIVYGSTEAEPVAHISLEQRLQTDSAGKGGFCVGQPGHLIKCKVIKITKEPVVWKGTWEQLECAQGEIGELIVTGDHVCKDYFNNLQAVQENKIIDSDRAVWHRMGDTGYFNGESFWLAGRVHSTIIRDGQLFHAQLVEQAISELTPEVKKIAALGLPDKNINERLIAVLQIQKGLVSAKDILKECREKNFIVDKILLTNSPLPLDPRHHSKINYPILRRRILNNELEIYDTAALE